MKYILKTDISGIQKFIFDIPSKVAAKQLKARSFYVYALTHIILEMLKDEMGENNVEEIYNGGGNLYAYVDNVDKDRLEAFREKVEKQKFQGVLFPFVSFVEVEEDFVSSKNKLDREVLKTKLQRNFDVEPFESEKPINWKDFTDDFAKSEGFIVEKGTKTNDEQIALGDYSLKFIQNYYGNKLPQNRSFKNSILNKLPKDEDGSIIKFETLAENVDGSADEKIAALKMDVDNLGKLFQNREEEEYRRLSGEMEIFFSKTLYTDVLKTYINEQKLYPVFAGGDDLFLIGRWDKIFEIAEKINNAFGEFSQKLSKIINLEKPLTLSGGIVVAKPKYPLIRIAEEAEEALELAKNYRTEKDSITIFGEPISWEEFEKCKEIKKDLSDLVINKGESRALIQRIKSSDLGFRSVQDKILSKNKIDLPKVYRLKYYLRNAKNDENRKVLTEIFDAYSEDLLNDFLNKNKDDKSNPAKYVIAARWTELLTRNKK